MNELIEILLYTTESGKCPFNIWLHNLRDKKMQAIVDARLTRLGIGLIGDCKSIKNHKGISELRIDYGAGYRIYFSQIEKKILLLLIYSFQFKAAQED